MITIPIVSTFKSTGFKQAEKATIGLNRQFKTLGTTLAATFSIRKITAFTKASIVAFAQEDKAVQALSRNLENLGLAYDIKPVEDYIRTLQYATGVADGELRPALQQLATSTKNLGTAQDLLNLALDISAGTGKSLASVTQALSRAYLGTTTSLSRLNIGLSKAELTSKSFNEITEDLTNRFSGQAARAAGTYAGQIAILSAAAGDAQEILGEKLIKSVEMLVDKEKGVPALAASLEDAATYAGNLALGIASIISLYEKLPGVSGKSGSNALIDGIKTLFPGGAAAKTALDFLTGLGASEAAKQRAKADMIARANAKELGILRSRALQKETAITKEKEKQSKLDKEKAKLEKAGEMFDDERISIAAALKNKSLDDNEILRLELKRALLNENATNAEKLANQLRESQKELASLENLKLINPFMEWEETLKRSRALIGSMGVPVAGISGDGTSLAGGTSLPPSMTTAPTPVESFVPVGGSVPYNTPELTKTELSIYVNSAQGEPWSDEVQKKIVDTVVEASSRGIGTGWFRTTGSYAIQ